ncbi:oligosaccharide flippase family protein [Flavobacterium jejuense]|uniref:Oligosaccharide flippase family protein n=1 Tax=Flavobacterium jejuense TaxID=1544455 RepID=A0ABX0IQN1_9FLAO|nr:oligosaccharide flippase family protein [Flavobacterium jejuense]NHN26144.1 oligosaccharide flippase family protein [Flavobacterium jejuense]
MSQLKKGAILSYTTIFLTNGLGLLLTPFIIRKLGNSEYGLYTLVGSLIAYVSVLDFGLNNAIVRFVAKYRAQNNRNKEENFLATTMIIYSFISLVVLLVGIVFYLNIETFFKKLTSAELEKAKILFAILIFNLTITLPGGSFSAISSAYERFVFPRALTLVKYLIRAFLIVSILMLNADSLGLVILDTTLNIVFISINAYYVFKYLKVRIKLHEFNWYSIQDIFSYSIWIFVYAIASQFQWQSGQIVLGAISGTKMIAIYSVGVLLGSYYATFSSAISGLFIPKAVKMITNNNSEKELTDTMIMVGRLCMFVLFLIFGGFFLFGKNFIQLWVGSTYNDSWIIALIIMIGYTTPLIQIFGNSILEAKGKYSFKAILNLIFLFFGVLLGVFLTRFNTAVGMILGICISWVVSQIILNYYYVKVIKLDIKRFFISTFEKMIYIFPLIICVFYFLNFIEVTNWFILGIKIFLYAIVYSIVIYKFCLNKYELSLVKGLLKNLKK